MDTTNKPFAAKNILEPEKLQKLLTDNYTVKTQEQQWQRQLIEHDMRLQNAKL